MSVFSERILPTITVAISFIAIVAASSIAAQEGGLESYPAVGRVLGAGSTCMGTLISESTVLTAGHCVFDERRGESLPAEAVRFSLSPREGEGVRITLRAARVHIEERYGNGRGDDLQRYANDMAIIILEEPVSSDRVTPMRTGQAPSVGSEVLIPGRRAGARSCRVLDIIGSARLLSCRVSQGDSGSPILRMVSGRSVIVGVLAGYYRDSTGIDGSISTPMGNRFSRLAALGAAGGGFSRPGPGAHFLGVEDGGSRSISGAMFIRP